MRFRAQALPTLYWASLAIEARAQGPRRQLYGHSSAWSAGWRARARGGLMGGNRLSVGAGMEKPYWRTPGDSRRAARFEFIQTEHIEPVTVLWPPYEI